MERHNKDIFLTGELVQKVVQVGILCKNEWVMQEFLGLPFKLKHSGS